MRAQQDEGLSAPSTTWEPVGCCLTVLVCVIVAVVMVAIAIPFGQAWVTLLGG